MALQARFQLKLQDLLLFLNYQPFIRGALAGKPQSFERTLLKPSGQIGHTWTQYIPDVDADGRVHGSYAMATDVGPLKDAEEGLKELNTSLRLARQEAEEAATVKRVFLFEHEPRTEKSADRYHQLRRTARQERNPR